MYKNVRVLINEDILNVLRDSDATKAFITVETGLSQLAVKKAIINDNHMIILWNDGTKTVTTCAEGDEFNPYVGIMSAFMKKVFGTETFHAKMDRAMKKIEVHKKPKKKVEKKETSSVKKTTTAKKTTVKK